ncbi:LysM peptidoglycan-binding domain-containing protein [uncultured Tenacibaculum sp.]|uniref:LysM peptidoglycan-binding domain-containing protein n=1 Tax=uncultured Tenacibaculum sp. TaxID=174713 RepID=UPI00261C4335|nr:LysM peptidoglycan-binding domain-containing protein [uncultured Tenacibaculum sp.]
MNKIVVLVSLFLSIVSFSQEKELPEGWDKILLEGKIAYMNLITGDVSTKFPQKKAVKLKKVVEYDPTITHTVQKGETLSTIARKYKMPLAQLYRLNSLVDFDTIEIGDKIVIGYEEDQTKKNKSKTINKEPIADHSDESNYHTVTPGETLYSISKLYNITVSFLKKKNKLSSNTIYKGQKLVIK